MLDTTQYGSGVLPNQLSITHQELRKAIQLGKPRWVLAHDHVVFTRSIFEKLGAKDSKQRFELLARLGHDDDEKLRKLTKSRKEILDDFRVLDMYDEAIRNEIKIEDYDQRVGNWVQKFRKAPDGMLFATAQFSRYRELEQFLKEQFAEFPIGQAVDAGTEKS